MRCLGSEPAEWADVSQNVKQRWLEVATALSEFYAEQVDCRWREVARRAAQAYHGTDTWPSMKMEVRLAFEAVSRHVCNLVYAEDSSDLRDAESFDWAEWMLHRMDKLGEEE